MNRLSKLHKRKSKAKALINGAMLLLSGIMAVVAVFPFVSVLINSFVDPSSPEFGVGGISKVIFLPYPISIKQYAFSILYTRETVIFFWNSVKITLPITSRWNFVFAIKWIRIG